jgi:hypothetical protein
MPNNCNCQIAECCSYEGSKTISISGFLESENYIQNAILEERNLAVSYVKYNYCPWCGSKINWKELENAIH